MDSEKIKKSRRIILKINLSEIILPFQKSRFGLDFLDPNQLAIRDQSNHEVGDDMYALLVLRSHQHFTEILNACFSLSNPESGFLIT